MKRRISPSKQYAIDLYNTAIVEENHTTNLNIIKNSQIPNDVNKSIVYAKYMLLLVQRTKINCLIVHDNTIHEGFWNNTLLFNVNIIKSDFSGNSLQLIQTTQISGKKSVQDYLNKILKHLCA